MHIVKNQQFSIYFGDTQQSISLEEIDAQQKTQALLNISQQLDVQQIAFLKQEHGIQGMCIAIDDTQDYIFKPVGDYLFTQRKNCAIGVVTADCLPIVIFDPVTQVVGIIHAGWKGLAADIFHSALHDMKNKVGIDYKNIEIYLGPAARPCCYEVQQDFIDKFEQYLPYFTQIFIQRDGKIYFDSRAFMMVLARILGINEEKIYTRYNVCTICDQSFCSYRREKEKARRQVTMICLH